MLISGHYLERLQVTLKASFENETIIAWHLNLLFSVGVLHVLFPFTFICGFVGISAAFVRFGRVSA